MSLPYESLTITADDGVELEAEWWAPNVEPSAVAVLCHPHPLRGGTMQSHVVHRLFAELPDHGLATLRFNFRGVGRSTGHHDDGVGEQLDIRAALVEATTRLPDHPVLLAGYSFGGDLTLAVEHPSIGARLAVSPPLLVVPPDRMAAREADHPVTIVTGTADQFRPPDQIAPLIDRWPTVELDRVDGVDHFWMQHLDRVTAAASALLTRRS